MKKSTSFNIFFLGANLFFLALCVSGLVLMLQVQTTKVALQEEEHPLSLSTIKNCLVQLDDLSHLFSCIIIFISHALTLPQTYLLGFLPVLCLSAYFLQVFICSPIVNCSSDIVAEHQHPRAVFSKCQKAVLDPGLPLLLTQNPPATAAKNNPTNPMAVDSRSVRTASKCH